MNKERAFGGVVFDGRGRVLLVEPANHYDGYIWTFPKGRGVSGETDEEAAVRETREEAGVAASIVAPLPGTFVGGSTETTYFLMSFVRMVGAPDWETASIHWATPEEAARLIALTTNAKGRGRDLAVLRAALAAREPGLH